MLIHRVIGNIAGQSLQPVPLPVTMHMVNHNIRLVIEARNRVKEAIKRGLCSNFYIDGLKRKKNIGKE